MGLSIKNPANHKTKNDAANKIVNVHICFNVFYLMTRPQGEGEATPLRCYTPPSMDEPFSLTLPVVGARIRTSHGLGIYISANLACGTFRLPGPYTLTE